MTRRRALPGWSAWRSTKRISRPSRAAPISRSTRLTWRRSSPDPCNDVAEARVDVQDLSGHRRGHVGEQERRSVAHVLDGDIAPQRRVLLDELEDLAEAADACGGERLDRPGGDGVHA